MVVDHFDETIADLESELVWLRAQRSPPLFLIAALERKIDELNAMRVARRGRITTATFAAA